MKVVQCGIAGARVVQTIPAFDKAIQNHLPRRESIRDPVKSISFKIAGLRGREWAILGLDA